MIESSQKDTNMEKKIFQKKIEDIEHRMRPVPVKQNKKQRPIYT